MKVSFIIAVYNQMDYVESSLISAFEQDYQNVEYIISDDFSSDQSFDVINKTVRIYNDKLNIKYHRNKKNLGIIENFKKNIKISTGDIVVGGSGDDIYKKNRVSLTVAAFNKSKRISAVFSNGYEIDKFNNIKGLIFKTKPIFSSSKKELFYKKTWIHGATASYKKEICEKFCQVSFKNNFQEDSIMSYIACIYGEIKYINKPDIGEYRYPSLSEKICILAASSVGENSAEIDEMKHSLFSYFLFIYCLFIEVLIT